MTALTDAHTHTCVNSALAELTSVTLLTKDNFLASKKPAGNPQKNRKTKVFIPQKAGMSPAFLVNNSKYRNNYPQLNVENQQVNLTIQLLENQIFGKSAVNQKIKRVYPTEKAMDIYPQLHEYEQKQSDFLLSNLSTEEIAQLKQLMAKLKY